MAKLDGSHAYHRLSISIIPPFWWVWCDYDISFIIVSIVRNTYVLPCPGVGHICLHWRGNSENVSRVQQTRNTRRPDNQQSWSTELSSTQGSTFLRQIKMYILIMVVQTSRFFVTIPAKTVQKLIKMCMCLNTYLAIVKAIVQTGSSCWTQIAVHSYKSIFIVKGNVRK